MSILQDKYILDASCGPRMMWFNKHHPNTLYIDNRIEEKGFIDNRENREIKPDIQMDFRKMDFPDKSFKLVVWDPPHIIQLHSPRFRLGHTFGTLSPESWQDDLKRGFKECWRVLEDYGVLIFKWNDCNKKLDVILRLFPESPLFGQIARVSKNGQSSSYWITFMKIPK